MTRSACENGVIWNDCNVVESTADGRCFLHSMVFLMKSQLFPTIETNTSSLLNLIKNEFNSHPERKISYIEGYKSFHFPAFER